MASRRLAAARKGAAASGRTATRRNSSRNTTRPSAVSSPMRVTKSGVLSDSANGDHNRPMKARSTTRSQTRSRVHLRDSDPESSSELSDADDYEDLEPSFQTSHSNPRRSTRAVHQTRSSSANNSGASRGKVGNGQDSGAIMGKAASGQAGAKTGRKRCRKSNSTGSATADDNSSEDSGGIGSGDESSAKRSSVRFPKAKRRRGRPVSKANTTSASKEQTSIIPNWLDPRMEHAIWVQTFRYAAISNDEEDMLDVNWLLRTARVCRDFADPALTVLYRCPPVKNESKARCLVELLEKPLSTTAINYRAKIETLHIDVRLISLQGFISPVKLMQNLPRLSEVLLLHGYDQAPYRNLLEPIRWTYPSDLWNAFEISTDANAEMGDKTTLTRLRSWQWSSRLMEKNWEAGLARMKQVHQLPTFASLRKLKLVNYQLPSVRLKKNPETDPELLAEDEKSVGLIAESLSVLENLEHVVFESSTIMCTSLFPHLPSRLSRLELINCPEVSADNLGSFLMSSGHQLEALVLNNNRSLSLSFLTILGTACPSLKELRMNFRNFSILETVEDNDPFYDHLLLPDQIPTWPSALELVHLENLRRWNMEAAETFLQSFIDSAPALPMLRYLSIKAMLDIPWRLRSGFRKSWQEKLETVFLRPIEDPQPRFTLRKQILDDSAQATTAKRKHRKPPVEPTRRSNRVVPQPVGASSRRSSASRELRGKKRKPQSYREPDSDEFDSDGGDSDVGTEHSAQDQAEGASDQSGKQAVPDGTFIQGLCTVVDINIDNQKPTEHQYSMDDFLNDERDFETDSEWDGGDVDYE